jgi:hypothetical protein
VFDREIFIRGIFDIKHVIAVVLLTKPLFSWSRIWSLSVLVDGVILSKELASRHKKATNEAKNEREKQDKTVTKAQTITNFQSENGGWEILVYPMAMATRLPHQGPKTPGTCIMLLALQTAA